MGCWKEIKTTVSIFKNYPRIDTWHSQCRPQYQEEGAVLSTDNPESTCEAQKYQQFQLKKYFEKKTMMHWEWEVQNKNKFIPWGQDIWASQQASSSSCNHQPLASCDMTHKNVYCPSNTNLKCCNKTCTSIQCTLCHVFCILVLDRNNRHRPNAMRQTETRCSITSHHVRANKQTSHTSHISQWKQRRTT